MIKHCLFALILGITNAVYDYSELVPMQEYRYLYRTLDCWECFEAQGKMCHEIDNMSMMNATGSSNRGHGVCCKPEYTGTHCGPSNPSHVCSPASVVQDLTSDYKNVLTDQTRNYQLFAFCPMTTQEICGLGTSNSTDMTLKANGTFQTVHTTDLKYVEGRPEFRQHDACYYEITAVDIATLDEHIMDQGDGY